MVEVIDVLRCCIDCYMTAANGSPSDDPDYAPDREPLSLIPEGSYPCAGGSGDEDGLDADGGYGFSWRRCEGCGSALGGDRYPITVLSS